MDDKLLDAVRQLLLLLLDRFGPGWTVGLVVVVLAGLWARGYRKDQRTDRAITRALDEKEKTIQRLANQERTWRRVFLTERMGMSPTEVDRLLQVEGEYRNAKESRTALERRTED